MLTFSAGLVAWTVAADLALAVRICAASLTSATLLVLITIVLWEGKERLEERSRQAAQAPTVSEATDEMEDLHARWQAWKSQRHNKAKKASKYPWGFWGKVVDSVREYKQRLVEVVAKHVRGSTHDLALPGGYQGRKIGPRAREARVWRNSLIGRGWINLPNQNNMAPDFEGGDEYDAPDLELPTVR